MAGNTTGTRGKFPYVMCVTCHFFLSPHWKFFVICLICLTVCSSYDQPSSRNMRPFLNRNVLTFIASGQFSIDVESWTDAAIYIECYRILGLMFGVSIPTATNTYITRWYNNAEKSSVSSFLVLSWKPSGLQRAQLFFEVCPLFSPKSLLHRFSDPFSHGTYAVAAVNSVQEDWFNLAKPIPSSVDGVNRIFWAGGTCSRVSNCFSFFMTNSMYMVRMTWR